MPIRTKFLSVLHSHKLWWKDQFWLYLIKLLISKQAYDTHQIKDKLLSISLCLLIYCAPLVMCILLCTRVSSMSLFCWCVSFFLLFSPSVQLYSSGQIWQVVGCVGTSSISREQVDIWSADIEVNNIDRKNTLRQSCHGDLLSQHLRCILEVVSNHSEAFHGTVLKHTAASSPH